MLSIEKKKKKKKKKEEERTTKNQNGLTIMKLDIDAAFST